MLFTTNNYLQSKQVSILITNNCVRKCGGCTQHCEILRHNRNEIWDIPVDQLAFCINALVHPCRKYWRKNILLFGGEPTMHPKFDNILELISCYRDCQFCLLTTVGWNKPVPPNLYQSMATNTDKMFVSSMVTAIDIERNQDKYWYWNSARRYCWAWNNMSCGSMIYDNKAFICCPGAAYERLLYGADNWNKCSGWSVVHGKDMFCRSNREIAEQASNLCWRCPISINPRFRIMQRTTELTKVSKSNSDLIKWEVPANFLS